MASTMQPSSRRPAGRGFLLLVLAVLAGLLAMHGLGPGSVPANASAAAGHHAMAPTHEKADHQVVEGCSHSDGGTHHHADATCAATGIGAPYAPPAPVAGLDAGPSPVAVPGSTAGTPESGRAPPDLAELQLLRI
ncbi:DUF6153 family protein [Streptomyces sp. NPDC006175]|uniref:DUF6153 family protein n=1 Tax=unclassified Streptomyces TaxID=2593676 RepID=UPI0033A7DD7C